MNYSILHIVENGLQLVQLKDEKNGGLVSVLPAYGALLHGFEIRTGDHPINVIDHYDSLDQLRAQLDSSYKSSKLSPFACRIRDGKYFFGGKRYEFSGKFGDGSAIHGLLFNKEFKPEQEKAGDDSASVAMRYQYRKDDDQYPFDYTCLVRYTLFADHLLRIETIITNDSNQPIPMADGWHPYFSLGGTIDEWILHFRSEEMVELDKTLIPTGALTPNELFNIPTRIGEMEMDNCFRIEPDKELPACEVFNPNNKLKISFYPDSSYPYLQIYTPTHRKSIAIENLSAAPDSFNNRMGLLELAPGQTQSFTVQYKLSLL